MSGFVRFSRACAFIVTIAGTAMLLGSCELAKNQMSYDRPADIGRQDYRDAMSPPPPPKAETAQVPDFQPVLSTPQELRLPTPLVSVSVNQTVGLRDLLFELAEQADVDIELDPQIRGTIIFTAKERPFDEVVDRISRMAGLRYTFKRNVLRVELDRPFVKSYNVNYLNISRTGESSITTSVTIGGSGGGDSADGSTGSSSGGSESSIDSTYDGDIWKELDENVKHILTATDTDVMLATLADPVSMPINPSPPPLPAVDPNNPSAPPPPPLPGSPAVSAMPAAAAPTINVTPSSEPVLPNAPATYSISRQTGIITVFASERQQRMVETYLNDFRRRATTQIMIEAKILQVELTDEFATGIDWGSFSLTGLSRITPSFPATPMSNPLPTEAFTAVLEPRDNLNITLQALSRFGTVRTLSSPRVTALNNQPAVVNVAENLVYFEIENGTSSTSTSSGTTTTGGIQAEAKTLPLGVLLNVIPSANPDTGEVFLNVRPTITKFVTNVPDPTPGLLALNATNVAAIPPPNNIPQTATQEMESLMRLQSGQTLVMGGLMEDSNNVVETGLPVASDLPVIGHLFKSHSDTARKSELVIFLTATIVPGSNVDDTDRNIYKTFSLDRHPSSL